MNQLDLFPKPEPPKIVDAWEVPRVPGRDMPCLRHKSYHSTADCQAELQIVEDAFEAAGGFLTADGKRRDSFHFHTLLIELGLEYGGYYIENDGSHTLLWSDKKSNRSYSINVKDWDGTAQGLRDRMEQRDGEWNRIARGGLL